MVKNNILLILVKPWRQNFFLTKSDGKPLLGLMTCTLCVIWCQSSICMVWMISEISRNSPEILYLRHKKIQFIYLIKYENTALWIVVCELSLWLWFYSLHYLSNKNSPALGNSLHVHMPKEKKACILWSTKKQGPKGQEEQSCSQINKKDIHFSKTGHLKRLFAVHLRDPSFRLAWGPNWIEVLIEKPQRVSQTEGKRWVKRIHDICSINSDHFTPIWE